MHECESLQGTVLVADDSEDNRELLCHLLRAHGYRVVGASDGSQALAAIESQPIDLALLDVMMPGQTGFSVCRRLKSQDETG